MGIKEQQIAESCLTEEQWRNSQRNEAWFWQTQKAQGNPEQRHKNVYYKGILEDGCTISRDFFAQDFTDSSILDIGSGPMGILHTIESSQKVAVDSLMDTYRALEYKVDEHDVMSLCMDGEHLFFKHIQFDYVLCLNALDHMKDPGKAIENISNYLKNKGQLLLIVDLRPEDKLDCYHKLAIAEKDVLEWIEPYFEIIEKDNIAHGDGTINTIRQLVIWCRKKSY